ESQSEGMFSHAQGYYNLVLISMLQFTSADSGDPDMSTQATFRAKAKEQPLGWSATYFGLVVEVIDPMPNVTLIRYQSREFLVYTEDLGRKEESRTIDSS